MSRALHRRYAFAIGVALVACGNVYADPVTKSFSSPFGTGTDSGVSAPPLPGIVCPANGDSLENAPCGTPSGVCEYGTSPDPSCNTTYRCVNDLSYGLYFTEQTRKTTCAFTCPKDPSTIIDGALCDLGEFGDGGTGDEEELQCATPLGTCACTTGADGAHAHPRKWVCVKPDPGCPPERPTLGKICIGEHSCDYGACDFKRGTRMQCQGESWQVEAATCK